LTKSAQSTGPESIGSERTLFDLLAPRQVLSLSRITLENNEKIRPEPDREKLFNRSSGGATASGVEPSFVDAARFARNF
jgi:hypothetical protein